jgi:hypothetical protein
MAKVVATSYASDGGKETYIHHLSRTERQGRMFWH